MIPKTISRKDKEPQQSCSSPDHRHPHTHLTIWGTVSHLGGYTSEVSWMWFSQTGLPSSTYECMAGTSSWHPHAKWPWSGWECVMLTQTKEPLSNHTHPPPPSRLRTHLTIIQSEEQSARHALLPSQRLIQARWAGSGFSQTGVMPQSVGTYGCMAGMSSCHPPFQWSWPESAWCSHSCRGTTRRTCHSWSWT